MACAETRVPRPELHREPQIRGCSGDGHLKVLLRHWRQFLSGKRGAAAVDLVASEQESSYGRGESFIPLALAFYERPIRVGLHEEIEESRAREIRLRFDCFLPLVRELWPFRVDVRSRCGLQLLQPGPDRLFIGNQSCRELQDDLVGEVRKMAQSQKGDTPPRQGFRAGGGAGCRRRIDCPGSDSASVLSWTRRLSV